MTKRHPQQVRLQSPLSWFEAAALPQHSQKLLQQITVTTRRTRQPRNKVCSTHSTLNRQRHPQQYLQLQWTLPQQAAAMYNKGSRLPQQNLHARTATELRPQVHLHARTITRLRPQVYLHTRITIMYEGVSSRRGEGPFYSG
jgi:hypothetical protein